LGQGKENVKKLLKEKVKLAEELDREIRKKVGLLAAETAPRKE
jgi:hypothetical protein